MLRCDRNSCPKAKPLGMYLVDRISVRGGLESSEGCASCS